MNSLEMYKFVKDIDKQDLPASYLGILFPGYLIDAGITSFTL